MEQDS